MSDLSPGFILIVGAVLVPFLRGWLRSAYMLALPVVAFALILTLEPGSHGQLPLFGMTLVTLRVDQLSMLFATVFLLVVIIGLIYALKVRDTAQHVATLVYGGSAVAAAFAGDLVSLFVFWEGTTLASVILVFAARTSQSYRAGMRYLLLQIGSGLALLAGAVFQLSETGNLAFGPADSATLAGGLLLIGFGVKAGFPLLNGWLKDAYPAATITGTVILSGITTKLGIYALIRAFPGDELLVPIGVVMALLSAAYAMAETDLRRVLAYSLNSQLGFMTVGVGIGTDLGLAGATAHAVSSALYQPLLFMAVGAVLLRVGSASTVGGRGASARSMPWTAGFAIVGAASVSAFPLFTGFASKALIVSAAMEEGYFWTWIGLLVASAAALVHTGIRVPLRAFFGEEASERPEEAPANMRLAMAIAAALCLTVGILPGLLYNALPFTVDYTLYTVEHVVTQLQLLMFAALAFVLLWRTGLYPRMRPGIVLDTDWLYRRLLKVTTGGAIDIAAAARRRGVASLERQLTRFLAGVYRAHGPSGVLARSWPTGSMAFWAVFLLGAILVLSYI